MAWFKTVLRNAMMPIKCKPMPVLSRAKMLRAVITSSTKTSKRVMMATKSKAIAASTTVPSPHAVTVRCMHLTVTA